MQTFADFNELKNESSPLFLAMGMFDGVHLGHQSVIESAIHTAKSLGGKSGVLTFNPHPSRIFHPENPSLLMFPLEQKLEILSDLGLDFTIIKHFDHQFGSLSAKVFLHELKENIPTLKGIFVGENFRFGKGRMGNLKTLLDARQFYGFHVTAVPRLTWDGDAISSTRIRNLLQEGKMETVASMLGRPYTISGNVVSGQKLGHKIGFPTINIPWLPELRPPYGVYAVTIILRDQANQTMKGIANYGLRPTVASDGVPLLEAHCFESCSCNPGDKVTVYLNKYMRPEKKFNSIDELKAQIAIDKGIALQL